MKQIALPFLMIMLFSISSYAQSYMWAYSVGGTSLDDLKTSHLGSDNQLVVTGTFSDTIGLGSTTLTSWGSQDVFVAKYDQNGQVLWAQAIKGDGGEWGYKVTTDNSNSVYVTGYFNSTALYFTPNDSIVRNVQSGRNVFLAKYNSNGIFQWARLGSGGTTGTYPTAFCVTTDNNYNVIIGGLYTEEIEFNGTFLPATSATNIFFVKFDSTGNVIWAKAGVSSSMCRFTDLCCDKNNDIYVTGKLSSDVTFGSTTVTGNQGDDVLVGKFNSSGTLLWMKVEGDPVSASTTASSYDCGTSIKVDPDGNVFVAGSFLDTTYYDMTTMTNIIKQSAFVAKYNNSGALQWMKKFGEDESNIINAIDLDANGDLYAIGTYRNAFSVGSISLLTSGPTSSFVAKFNSLNGNTEFAYRNGTSFDNSEGWGIGVDQSNGKIYTTGNYKLTTNFGPYTLASQGSFDMYVALLDNSVMPTDISETSTNLFAFYPNPTEQFIHISASSHLNLDKAHLTIFSLTGDVIHKKKINALKIDLGFLKAGSYLIQISDERASFKKQIVKL